MTNALQNLNSQAARAQGRVSAGEQDLFSILGEQLKQDPELAKLFSAEGEIPANFQEALANMSFDEAQALVDKVNQQTGMLEQNQEQLNQKVQTILPENVSRLGRQANLAEQAMLGEGETLKTGESLKGSEAKSELAKLLQGKIARNAEDASRQFMPERKSIFAVQKEVATQQTGQSKEAQMLQNNQGLVDLQQFMAKQSPSAKERAARAQYKNEQQSLVANKAFVENTKHETFSAPLQVQGESAALKDWSHGQEQALSAKPELNNLQAVQNGAKVFDMTSLSKTNDIELVINQIQDYVTQVRAAKEPSASMTFNHPELGDIDLFVQKAMGNKVNVVIGHNNAEAAKFFQQHQAEMLHSLNQSGVQVGEFKLESSSSNNNNNNQNNSEQNGKQFANQNQSNGQHKREGAQRREDLWNLLREERKFA